jgi:hypothetical protein
MYAAYLGTSEAALAVGGRHEARVFIVLFAKVLLAQLHEVRMINATGCREHHTRRFIVRLKIVDQLRTFH